MEMAKRIRAPVAHRCDKEHDMSTDLQTRKAMLRVETRIGKAVREARIAALSDAQQAIMLSGIDEASPACEIIQTLIERQS
jgi:hypothetical protein